jgi:hypothetical protein
MSRWANRRQNDHNIVGSREYQYRCSRLLSALKKAHHVPVRRRQGKQWHTALHEGLPS